MNTLKWVIISIGLHVLLISGIGVWNEHLSTISRSEILDLTLENIVGTPTGNKEIKTPAKMAVKKKVAPSATASSSLPPSSSDDTNAPTDGQESGASDGSGDTPWSEITELPKVVGEVKAHYPEAAKKAGVSGPVVLEIIIDKQGKVESAQVISGPGSGLNEAALEAIYKFKFKPAKKLKEAVPVKIRYTYRFKLDIQ